ncbi:PREDICTED: mucin-17 [Chrysochloris asiatica]|uniref:Mucin-17 n=1 Tax=Chrysochloris asiatica TaxID=185453 RepID=A0A9B0TFU2_CHRAS|nr:PREDICTED: mucin-17 [Chrysochloris asiatica]
MSVSTPPDTTASLTEASTVSTVSSSPTTTLTPSSEASSSPTDPEDTTISVTTATVGGTLGTTIPGTTTLTITSSGTNTPTTTLGGAITSAPTSQGTATLTTSVLIPSEGSTLSTPTPHTSSAGTSVDSSLPTTTSDTSMPVTPGLVTTTDQTSQATPSVVSTTVSITTSLTSTSTVTSKTIPTITSSSPTTTKGTCLNGGTWNNSICDCLNGFGGNQCQYVCKNGGIWDGDKCNCTPPYEGSSCDKLMTSIEIESPPKRVTAQVGLSVTVTSKEFTEELNNKSSIEFKNFTETFAKQMAIAYNDIPEYDGVLITNLTNGSVVVEHKVLLKANFTQDFQKVMDTATKAVEEKIMNLTRKQIGSVTTCSDLLCFNDNATKVGNTEITQYDPEAECQKKAGKDFGKYFLIEYRDQKPYCISACMPGFRASMNCHFGQCKLERSGPRCYCLTTDTHWYRGKNCELGTQKTLVYGLVGAAGVIVLLIFMVLLVFMFRSKREVYRISDISINRQKIKVSQLSRWHDEDGGSTPGTFENIGFDICEEPENSINLNSIYKKFQPSLNQVDPKTKHCGAFREVKPLEYYQV